MTSTTTGPILSSSTTFHSSSSDRAIRRRHAVDGRIRSGCTTCKARRKKCDGRVSPSSGSGSAAAAGSSSTGDDRCKACIRLGLVCEWLPLRQVTARPRTKGSTSSTSIPSTSTTKPSLPPPPPSSSSPSSAVKRQAPLSPSACSTTSSLHPSGDSGGMLSAVGATATANSGSNMCCQGGEHHHDSVALAPAPLASPYPFLPSVPVTGKESSNLLKYFLDRAAPMCSILQQDGHRFCSVLLPMAFFDSSLLHAVFTYALIHSDATRSAPTLQTTPRARLQFETQVARGLSEAISQKAVAESTVASALVISLAEVIDGDTSRWLLHLQGAGHFINHLSARRLLQTSDGAFLLRNFAYHDIMASLSTRRRPLIEGVYWVEDVDATVDSADSFMGLAHHILRHISDICFFVADTVDLVEVATSSSPSSSSSTASVDYYERLSREMGRGVAIACALQSQSLHLSPNLTDNNTEALLHHAEAFRHAALIHLYRHLLRMGGNSPDASYEARIQESVLQVLQHVSMIPSNIVCEIGLLFPLFMAGLAGGYDPETVDYVQSRYKYIEEWSKFKHVTRARELLEMLWAEERTDWEAKLEELQWQISLG